MSLKILHISDLHIGQRIKAVEGNASHFSRSVGIVQNVDKKRLLLRKIR